MAVVLVVESSFRWTDGSDPIDLASVLRLCAPSNDPVSLPEFPRKYVVLAAVK